MRWTSVTGSSTSGIPATSVILSSIQEVLGREFRSGGVPRVALSGVPYGQKISSALLTLSRGTAGEWVTDDISDVLCRAENQASVAQPVIRFTHEADQLSRDNSLGILHFQA